MGAPVGTSTRIFVDFWNFQLNWNDRAEPDQRCDWKKLPAVLLDQAREVLSQVGLEGSLDLEETLVHASVKMPSETRLKNWLENWLDKQPSYRVKVRERRVRPGGMWCNTCKRDILACPSCDTPLVRAPEKGIDAAIVTDLLTLAGESAFDVAILLTSDADLVPAVERVQEKGLKVINATWAGHGHELAHTCWGHFKLDGVIARLARDDLP